MFITQTDLFWSFIFAAAMYAVGIAVVYYRIGGLQANIDALLVKLDTSDKAKERLQKSIDALLQRPDHLLDCLQAAQTDDEKKECIRNLMGLK